MERRFGINFDRLAKRFKKNIYGSQKGELRKQILWSHMQEYLPLKDKSPLKIIDLGCGEAPFAEQLLTMGHHLTLCDMSQDMIEAAKARLNEHPAFDQVKFVQGPLQEISAQIEGLYDIVMAHAVIEWIPESDELFDVISELLADNGYLSLMFYNRNSLLFRNMQLGNWRRVKNEWLRGRGKKTLTPINPQDPESVYAQCAKHQLSILSRAGVRVFYDYLDRDAARSDISILFEMEQRYSRQEPFLSMARYIHVISVKDSL